MMADFVSGGNKVLFETIFKLDADTDYKICLKISLQSKGGTALHFSSQKQSLYKETKANELT
jgi:hypothetical protein